MGWALLWPLVTRKNPEPASPLTEHAFWLEEQTLCEGPL